MADSDALRQRRRKAHVRGDHSICRPGCAARRPVVVSSGIRPGEVTDPVSELRQLAWRMAEAHRADPGNAMLGAELRRTLLDLMPKAAEKADDDLTGLYEALSA